MFASENLFWLVCVQGPPAKTIEISLELFSFLPVLFFPQGRAVLEADLTFPESRGVEGL